MRWIDRMGAELLGLGRATYHVLGLLYLSGKVLWVDRDLGQRPFIQQTLLQVYHSGVGALPAVVLLAALVGGVAGVLPTVAAATPGGVESMSQLISQVVMQHLTPWVTGSLVIIRSVPTITADLGIMRVQREIEAVEVMGLSPVGYLITPRIVGGRSASSA